MNNQSLGDQLVKQAWENVESLLSEMAPLLIESGVPERQVKMPSGRPPEEIKVEQYVKAFDWLHQLKMSTQWEALVKAKALVKPHQWEHYKAHNIRGLREQTILESAQLGVRKSWKLNRPTFFGRVYKQPEAEDGQDSAG